MYWLRNMLKYLTKGSEIFVTRLRISAHSLRIQTDRYSTTDTHRIDRICKDCDTNEIEYDFHSVIS